MLETIKEKVLQSNLALPKYNLVTFTWGNVSEIDKNTNLIVIKPSGVLYETMSVADMIIVDLEGNIVEGNLKPSSDLHTHLVLYKKYPLIGAIVHTHSTYATSWAQAGRDIPCYGTTHADYFYGPIPCTRDLKKNEVQSDYEANTGTVIIETLIKKNLNPLTVPGILCEHHGVFTFGKDSEQAVHNAVVIEELAKMAYLTEQINPKSVSVSQHLLNKHYHRKHGKNAYYGQATINI